jgi:hypothetical protein
MPRRVFRQRRRVATAAGRASRASSKFAYTFGFILTAIMGATSAQRARVLARTPSSSSASPPPQCPGNSGARRRARHGEEAVHRVGNRASSARSCTSSPPARNDAASPSRRRSRPLLLLLTVWRSTVASTSPWRARPLRARRRAVTAPSPQPSPAPPLVLKGKATASLLPRPHTQRRRRAARELCAACCRGKQGFTAQCGIPVHRRCHAWKGDRIRRSCLVQGRAIKLCSRLRAGTTMHWH